MQNILRFQLIVAGFAAALISPATPVLATSVSARPLSVVSGETPLAGQGCGSDAEFQDWEQDNSLAVNPANGSNMVAAWQQDFADAITVGYSGNRGATWRNVVPKTTLCTWLLNGVEMEDVPSEFQQYGRGASAFDPWVTFGRAPGSTSRAIAYLTSSLSTPAIPRQYVLVVNRSFDGGRTWTDPYVLDRAADPADYIDTSFVLADPARPGRAYALWAKGNFTNAVRDQYIRRTDNGGEDNWKALAADPVKVPSTPGRVTFAGRLLVLPDPAGTLVNVAAETAPQPGAGGGMFVGSTTLVARRSTDGGRTWSASVEIAQAGPDQATAAATALGPDGAIYAVWARAEADGSAGQLTYSKSTDGGVTWCRDGGDTSCTPGAVGAPIQGSFLLGDAAVAPDGTVGVLFYDRRRDPENPPRTTDLWLRHSHDGGAHWTDDHIAGPFDQTTAPFLDIGDYQGIAPVPEGFATTFVLAEPLAAHPPTGVFFAKIPTAG